MSNSFLSLEDTAEMTLGTSVTGVMISLAVHKAIETIFTSPHLIRTLYNKHLSYVALWYPRYCLVSSEKRSENVLSFFSKL